MRSILTLVFITGVSCFSGCVSRPAYLGKYPPCYEYTSQVLAMPSCQVTMEVFSPCERRFRTTDEGEFYIGSPGADAEVMDFLSTLEEGKTYYLPRAFMEHRKAQQKKPNKQPEATR